MQNPLFDQYYAPLSTASPKRLAFHEYPIDAIRPIAAYEALVQPQDNSVLLESAEYHPAFGRYSYLGFDPYCQFISHGRDQSLNILKKILAQQCCAVPGEQHSLVGGGVGYLAYDAIRHFESIPDRQPPACIPDILFLFHRLQIVFQHDRGVMIIYLVAASPDEHAKAMRDIEAVYRKITDFKPCRPIVESGPEAVPDISDEMFCRLVEKSKGYIHAGDIFQTVLSRNFKKAFSGSVLDLYHALRQKTPAPYMFLLNTPSTSFAGASPEKLVSIRKGILETQPIAGTRPRGNGIDDQALAQELLSSEKEMAEHMMLVDLARNDLGMVSIPGSVVVKELKAVHLFSHVMHIVSKVQGRLREDRHPLDALRAVFPAGTLSGAPKIRAMEIIDELETSRRGLYGGAVFHIDGNGDLESCIAIRMASLKDGIATVRAGVGIVYDSDPRSEADETRQKAKGVLESLKLAEEAKE